jgi:hypothetical protein
MMRLNLPVSAVPPSLYPSFSSSLWLRWLCGKPGDEYDPHTDR